LINQNVNFATSLGSIGWVCACFVPTQRGSAGATVNRLPFPLDASLATIETQQRAKYLLPDPLLLPGLKSLMQNTARNTKPGAINGFPLASSPQNKPQTVHHGPIRLSAASCSGLPFLFGKVLFGNSPQRTWNLTIVRAARFYDILFHDVSRLVLVWRNRILSRIRPFVQLLSIFG
jgi:hypothetical protein